jgi:hypothetical protein
MEDGWGAKVLPVIAIADLSESDIRWMVKRLVLDVTVSDVGCWEWRGGSTGGRGVMALAGTTQYVYHLTYQFFTGPIPGGLTLDHLCRNPACVNPDHLEVVTRAVNVRRQAATATTCRNGHPISESYVHPTTGYRRCRLCHREAERVRRGMQAKRVYRRRQYA